MVEHPDKMDAENIAPRTEIPHKELYPPNNQIIMGQQTLSMSLPKGQSNGFSDSPMSGGVDVGQFTEDEIAEAIFDWWISGKPYKQWYAEKYLQQKIDFDFNDETTTSEEDNGMEQG